MKIVDYVSGQTRYEYDFHIEDRTSEVKLVSGPNSPLNLIEVEVYTGKETYIYYLFYLQEKYLNII